MPRFDKTGPMRMGPGTGRGMGPCMGFGPFHFLHHRRGWGRMFNWLYSEEKEEKWDTLTQYIKALEEELEDAKKEIEAMKAKK